MAVQNNPWKPWIPVLVWLGVLVVESSDLGSSDHTGALLRRIWTALLGLPDPRTLELVNHLIRKTGHFVGYAILSWLIFRALRAAWRNRQELLLRGRDYFWQPRWAVLGIAGTALAASADEIHQTFNSARTGRWQDVVLDSAGAFMMQLVLYLTVNKS